MLHWELAFTDPLILDDLDLYSRPADYISFKVHALDNKTHHVQIYFSAAGDIAVNTPDQPVTWKRSHDGSLDLMRVGTTSQQVLARKGDNVRIDWGYLIPGSAACTRCNHRHGRYGRFRFRICKAREAHDKG